MKYYKNTELAKLHSVSEGTVRRWIDAARDGKNELQLYAHEGKTHIANTAKNMRTIEELVAKGKKHGNSRWSKVVVPTEKFYKRYSKQQIADIINNIEIHREIPLQYNYFEEGAKWWDAYSQKLWDESEENMLTGAIELLRSNFENIRRAVRGYERVNLVDIGTGNALPVKELLTQLLYEENILGRYIGVDVSQAMLRVAKRNLKEWFDGQADFEIHLRDITFERFDDLLIDEDPETTVNVVMLLGGTLQNFRAQDEVLKTVLNSMGRNDIFITSTKLDSLDSRLYFDLVAESGMPKLILGLEHQLNLFGIDSSLYDVEQAYDNNERMRYSRIRLKVDLTIKFNFAGKERHLELRKGEAIILWRYWHLNTLEYINLLERNGFALLDSSLTNDQQFFLTISKIKPTATT